MNIREYMKNPAGKGAVIPGREALLEIFNRRYITMCKTKPIQLNVYTDKEIVYYHILITTEADNRDNTYDVILKFIPTSQADINDKSVRNYELKFFSNCPSFTYTYAYVAKINDILVEELSNKYDDQVLKNPPVSRNPGLIFNYEKSTYYACKFLMESNEYLNKTYIKSHGKKITKNILKEIRTDSVIEEEIMRSKRKAKEDKRKKKDAEIEQALNNRNKKQNPVKKSGVNYIKPKQPINKKNGGNRKQPIKPIGKRR